MIEDLSESLLSKQLKASGIFSSLPAKKNETANSAPKQKIEIQGEWKLVFLCLLLGPTGCEFRLFA